jgi:hypothetical protein
MDILIDSAVFGQVQHIDPSMSPPIKQAPSSDVSDTEDDPSTKSGTPLHSLPSWQDSFTEFDPNSGVEFDPNEAILHPPPRNQPSATLRSDEHEHENAYTRDTDFARAHAEFAGSYEQTLAHRHVETLPSQYPWYSHAAPPSTYTPEVNLDTETGPNPPYLSDGVSHFGFPPNFCYFV